MRFLRTSHDRHLAAVGLCMLLALLFVVSCSSPKEEKPEPADVKKAPASSADEKMPADPTPRPVAPVVTTPAAGEKVIWGFEGEDAAVTVTGRSSLVTDKTLVTEGASALKLMADDGQEYLTLKFVEAAALEGWKGQNEMLVDVWNLSDRVVTMKIRLDDAASTGSSSRIEVPRKLEPGLNTVRLSLRDLRTPDGRNLDVSMLQKLYLYFYNPPAGLEAVFDNLRLK